MVYASEAPELDQNLQHISVLFQFGYDTGKQHYVNKNSLYDISGYLIQYNIQVQVYVQGIW